MAHDKSINGQESGCRNCGGCEKGGCGSLDRIFEIDPASDVLALPAREREGLGPESLAILAAE